MNLDILIRIRDQLAGLNRAQQGLRDLNAQVAGSSKQWTQMAAGALGVTAAVGLLGAEIRHVVANIAEIPGVPPETQTSIQMMKDNFSQARATLDQWLAKGAEWFSQIGQGLGYLAGAAVYGWDAASDAYGAAEKEAEAALEAAKNAKTASKALEDQHRAEEEASKRLASALDALAKAREESDHLTETAGQRMNRLNAEAAALRNQAEGIKTSEKDPKDKRDAAQAQKTELTAQATQKETEARKLLVQLNQELAEIGDRQRAAALEKLSLAEQLEQAEARIKEINEQTVGIDIQDNVAVERGGKLEAERLDLIERIAGLKEKIAAKEKEAAQHALAAHQAAIQAALLQNTLARGKLDSDYTKTEAEKWGARKRLIEDSIAAQQRYIAGLQKIAEDASQPADVRAEASRDVTSGNRDLGNMQNDLAGLGPDPFSTIEQLKASLTSLKESWGTTAQQIAEGFTNTIGTAMQGTSDALYDWISGAATAKDAWLGALQSIGQSFLRMITDMVAKMIWRSTVERALIALGVMTHVQGETAKTAATTTGGGIRLLTGIKEALASVYKGALFAFEALASIPYVGPFLGAAAMAAAIAGGIALVSKIGHADGGYIAGPGSGTSDSIPAMLSNGEYVIPADKVQQYGRGFFDSIRSGSFIAGAAPSNNSALQSYGIAAAVAPAAAPESGAGGVGEMAIGVFDRRTAVEDFLNSKRGQKILFDAHRNTARQIG